MNATRIHNPRWRIALRTVLTASAILLFAVPSAHGANITKAGSGTDLTAGASWTGLVAPTSSDVATWDTGSLGAGLSLNSGTPSWRGTKVNAGASDPLDIASGGTLTLGTSGIDMSASAINATIGCNLTLSSGYQSWLVNSGRTLAINGTVTPSAGAAVNFPATGVTSTTLANVNGIIGCWATTGNAGTSGSTGDWAAMSGGNVVAYTGYTGVAGALANNSAANYNITGNSTAGSITVNSVRMGADLTIGSGNTLYLNSGGLMLNGISRWLKAGNTSSALTVNGGQLYIDSTGSGGSGDDNWQIQALIVNNGATPLNLSKNGPGMVILTALNTFTGNIFINSGRLSVGTGITGNNDASIPSNLGNVGSGVSRTITINNGGTLSFTSGNVFGWSSTPLSGVTLVVNQGGIFQVGVNGTGSGFFSKIGAVNLNGGSILVGNGDAGYNSALALLGTVTVAGSAPSTIGVLSGATSATYAKVTLGQSNPGINSVPFNVADVTGDSNADLTVSAILANQANNGTTASSLTKSGAGTMRLTAANTYTGGTTISAGTLQLGGGSLANTAIALSGTGTFAVKPGSSTTINAGTTGAGTAGATLNLGGLTFDMGDSATSTFNLQQQDSFASTALTIATGATLKFDLGGSTTAADLLAVTKAASMSGTVNVTVNTIGSTALSVGTYNLITAASGLNGGTWQFTGGGTKQTVTLGGTRSNIRLNNSSTAVSLTVADAYTVTYDGNGSDGGIVPTDSNSPYDSGASVTVVSAGTMTQSGYTFTGWNTQADGSGTAYSPGGSFNISSDTTLYAQWTLASATITAPSTFPGAVSTTYGTASSAQSVAVSGAGLTVYITATAMTSGLEVSSDGVNFGPTATFTQTGGSASGTLYVRLSSNAPVSGSYNSQLVSLTSTGAPTVNVATTASGNAVAAKSLTVTGAVAQDKIYDGSNAAVITEGALVGVVGSDDVTLTLSGTFPSSAAGGPYTVTSTSTLGGTAAGNYTLTQPTGLTASIFASAVWNGGGGDANWSTSLNWASSLAPGLTGNPVSFAGSTQTSPNMDNNYSVTGVTFDSGTASFTIGTTSSTLTLTGGVTNNSVNAQTLNVPISMSGAQTFNAAAGDLTFGQNVANGVNAITLTGTSNTVINGVISGSGIITKTGSGTAALNGSVASGSVTVSAGKLNLGGSYTSGNANNPAIASGAVLEISGGTLTGTAGSQVWDSSFNVGTTSGYVSGLRMSAGSLTLSKQLALANSGGFGGYSQSGGTAALGGFLAMGLGNGVGILNQSGGTFTVSPAPITCGAGGSSYGGINLSGTAVFNVNGSGDNCLWLGESGAGSLNISAGAALNFATANNGLQLGRNGSGSGVVNLLGGTVTTKAVYKGSGTGTLNFNGGTLKANQANTSFLTGLTAAYVHGGGAVINDGGFAVTVGQALLAPSGSGVTSIPVTVGGSGYIESPQVTISGGGGSGATAIAQIDYTTGAITNILVTSPGNDYTSAPTVTLTGGGGSGATIGTATIDANISGGLTKVGAGTLTLSGTSTYTGNTVISNGTLRVNGVLGNTAVAVKSGATLGGNGTIGGAVFIQSGGTLSPSGTFPATLTVTNTLDLAGVSSFRINATQSDKVSGVTTFTSGGTLNVTLDSGSLTGGESYTLVQATTYGGTAPTAGTLPTLGSGLNWYLGKMPVNGTISVNRAPTASDLVTSVESGRSVSIVVIGGKHAPADADAGDTANLQISGVGGLPTLGSASTDGTSVTYTSSGSTGSDSFTYTVSDGRGGTVTKTVTVTVTGGSGANIISLTGTVPNITVNFAGMPSSTYAIERATSPSGPWSEITASVSTGANGLGSYLDNAAPSPTGYYRTRYVSTP